MPEPGTMHTAHTNDPFQIVIQSSIHWDFLWQGHQIRAGLLADHVPVTFVETTGIRRPGLGKAAGRLRRGLIGDGRRDTESRSNDRRAAPSRSGAPDGSANVRIVSPIVLPPFDRLSRSVNRRVLLPRLVHRLALDGRPIIYLTYLPTASALALRDILRPAATVYHALLDFSAFPATPRDIAKTERELVSTADRVIVDSEALRERFSSVRNDVATVQPGVDYEHFRPFAPPPDPAKSSVATRTGIHATYFGGMASHRFDWNLVRALADAGIQVTLLGPVPDDHPRLGTNVRFEGSVPYAELPFRLSEADVLILPYLQNEFTRSTFPVKLFQCFATGKPVVATPLPEVARFAPLVTLAEDAEAFVRAVKQHANEPPDRPEARRSVAGRHSWETRTNELLGLLRDAFDRNFA